MTDSIVLAEYSIIFDNISLFKTNVIHFSQGMGPGSLHDSNDQLDFFFTKNVTGFEFCTVI